MKENDSLRNGLFHDSSDEETIAPQSFRTIEPAVTDDDGEEEESSTHQPKNQTTQDQTQTG